MKISQRTLSVLKNFGTMNQSIRVRPGNRLRTMSSGETAFATADVAENFETEFAIFDLSKFLAAISLFNDPDFEFFDDHVKLAEGKNVIRYVYGDPAVMVLPPDREIKMPSREIYFEVAEADMSRAQKAISVLGVPELTIVGEDGTTYIRAANVKNPSAGSFSLAVGIAPTTFTAVFNPANLKLLPADYRVTVSTKGIAEFASDDVTYWVVAEHTSKFDL